MQSETNIRTVYLIAVATLGAMLAGCASAPVQQMSDARQAIRAAQEAGATPQNSARLAEAQAALNRAETLLNKHFFRAARRDAEAAHASAVEALEEARDHNGSK